MSLLLKHSKTERLKPELDLDRKLVNKETQTVPSGTPNVPEGYRDLLLEFTINYNLHHPKNILEYAAEYFAALKDQKHTKIVYDLVSTEKDERKDWGESSVVISEVDASEISRDEHGVAEESN